MSDPDSGMFLGTFILAGRKILKLSQAQLAERAGLSRNQISLMERHGVSNCKWSTIYSVFKALGVKLNVTLG